MMKQLLWMVATCVLLLASCRPNTVYEHYITTNPTAWSMQDSATFTVNMQDTTGHYHVLLQIHHTSAYPYQHLWLFTHSVAPDSTVASDTLNCFLADNAGRWLGQASLSTYEMPLLYMQNIRFPHPGTYTFSITHGMRDSLLVGISHIGLTIEPISIPHYVEE